MSKNKMINNEITDKSAMETKKMQTFYRVTSDEMGAVLLKRRKIAKALRWWLRENGINYTSTFFIS
jgi:hypothetical protein